MEFTEQDPKEKKGEEVLRDEARCHCDGGQNMVKPNLCLKVGIKIGETLRIVLTGFLHPLLKLGKKPVWQ